MFKKHFFRRPFGILEFVFHKNVLNQSKFSVLTKSFKCFFSESNYDGIELLDQLEENERGPKNLDKTVDITNCKTIQELLDFYDQQKRDKKSVEKFLVLRMFGRIVKSQSHQKEHFFSDRYYRFMREEIISSINVFDQLSFFFFFKISLK